MIYPILLISLIFRLILANQSIWLDEGASLVIANQPLSQLISSLSGDFHPPLYYLFLHFWLKLGFYQEWFLRLPNIIFGVGTVGVTYLLLNQIFPKTSFKFLNLKLNIGDFAAITLALNPLHIYYSQELRMYSINALLTIITWYFLYLSLNRPQKSSRNIFSLLFIIFSAMNLYTFYGAFFNLFAQFVFVILTHRRQTLRFLLFSFVALILFSPWIPTLTHQFAGSHVLKNLPGWADISGSLTLKNLLLVPAKFSMGRINFSVHPTYLLSAAVVSFYFLTLIFLSIRQIKSRLFLIWLIIPLLTAAIISLKTPMLGYWRYIYLLPAFSALITIGIFELPKNLRQSNFIVIVTTLFFLNLFFWITPAFQRENWKEASNFISKQTTSDTVTLFAFSDAFAPIRWYLPELEYGAPLTSLSQPVDLDLELNQLTLGKNHILFFDYLSAMTDPNHNIAAWLDNAGFVLEKTHNFTNVGLIYEYRTQ